MPDYILSLYTQILFETYLFNNCAASIDAQGNLLLIKDDSLPETQQTFIYLNANGARNLRDFLNTKEVQEAIR